MYKCKVFLDYCAQMNSPVEIVTMSPTRFQCSCVAVCSMTLNILNSREMTLRRQISSMNLSGSLGPNINISV